MHILLTCVVVHHVYAWEPKKVRKRLSGTLELELRWL